ncbi:AIR synthase-related protein [Klebsiella pneumoniae]|nr:AIR synthase-related protein [Klebsiella pneumoniae]
MAQRKLPAYHDRSDGGLLVTLAEMAFTGHCGVEADIAALATTIWPRCSTKSWGGDSGPRRRP